MTKKRNKTAYFGYPSDGYYYGICDICGKKLRIKEMKKTWGTRGTLLVCPADYEDPHPHDYIKSFKERKQPALARPEATDSFRFVDEVTEIETSTTTYPTGRSPDAPTNLVAEPSSSTVIVLKWRMDKSSPGSGPITGFKIERESPTGNGFSTIVSTTGFPSLYYENTSLTADTQYNYRVSAINAYGTSSASTEAAATTAAS